MLSKNENCTCNFESNNDRFEGKDVDLTLIVATVLPPHPDHGHVVLFNHVITIVKEMLTCGNRLRFLHYREFDYFKLCSPGYFVRHRRIKHIFGSGSKFGV